MGKFASLFCSTKRINYYVLTFYYLFFVKFSRTNVDGKVGWRAQHGGQIHESVLSAALHPGTVPTRSTGRQAGTHSFVFYKSFLTFFVTQQKVAFVLMGRKVG